MTLLNSLRYINRYTPISNNLKHFTDCLTNVINPDSIDSKRILKKSDIHFNPYGYRRIPLYDFDNINVLLLEWLPKSCSPVHDHHDKGCITILLRNQLSEDVYCKTTHDFLFNQDLNINQVNFIDNSKYNHSMYNSCDDINSISLHIYPKIND